MPIHSSVLVRRLCACATQPEAALGERRGHAGLSRDFLRAGEQAVDREPLAGLEVLQHGGIVRAERPRHVAARMGVVNGAGCGAERLRGSRSLLASTLTARPIASTSRMISSM